MQCHNSTKKACTFRSQYAFCFAIAAVLISGCTPSVHDCIAQMKLEKAGQLLAEAPERADSRTNKGKTPVHTAVYYNDLAALELLLEHGADISAVDDTGMTPLHDAAQLWREQAAEWLLAHGADIAAVDMYGDSPAHVAAMVNGGPMLQLFFAHGADLSVTNLEGKSPAALAREHGHERAAALIEKLSSQ